MLLSVAPFFQLHASPVIESQVNEYGVKAAFIFNFIAFTHWPDSSDQELNLCIYGNDYFGQEIDQLQKKPVNNSAIKTLRLTDIEKIEACQVLFISKSAIGGLPAILKKIYNKPILTIADSQDAASQGVIINMMLIENKIKFEINLKSARDADLQISSKLLQLATKVYQ
ncbi:MAG: YfiR family protein [Burkholderiales bacterium]|nr:YfiR family protein [Burkholderiales bacterium]MDR4518831.1 YfiR family protein [Nitrosomonas sp.]